MTKRAVFIILASFVLTTQALAGTVNVTDGQGSWTSTKCQPPKSPEALSQDAEAAANDLNAQMGIHNQYVSMAQAYMNCLSQEAQSDAQVAGQIITRAAQALIQETQTQVNNSAARFKK